MTEPLTEAELEWLAERFRVVETGHPKDGTLEGIIARLLATLDAERERIAREVESLEGQATGTEEATKCFEHKILGCSRCRSRRWVPDGDSSVRRSAVLAIVRGDKP